MEQNRIVQQDTSSVVRDTVKMNIKFMTVPMVSTEKR